MTIPSTTWPTFLWPGLAQLTQRGSGTAVFWALTTAFLADGVVITKFIWPETFAPGWDNLILAAFVGVYTVGCIISYHLEMLRTDYGRLNNVGDQFALAQDLYLKGRYCEAEKILTAQIQRNPADIAAQILLIDLLKTTRRLDEAQQRLENVLDIPEATAWRWEIISINDQLKQLRQQPEQENTEQSGENEERTSEPSDYQTFAPENTGSEEFDQQATEWENTGSEETILPFTGIDSRSAAA